MCTRNSKDLIVKSLSPCSGFIVFRLLNPNLFSTLKIVLFNHQLLEFDYHECEILLSKLNLKS